MAPIRDWTGAITLFPHFLHKIGSPDKPMGEEAKTKTKKNSLLAMPVLRTCRWRCGMSDFKLRA